MLARLFNSKVARNLSVYLITDVLNKSISLLLLPILTRFLTRPEYGLLGTFNAYVAIVSVFVGLSVQTGVAVNYFKMETEEFRRFVANALLILLGSTLLVMGVVAVIHALELISFPFHTAWVYLGILSAAGNFLTIVNLTLWQVEQRAKAFGAYQVSLAILNAAISILLVVGCHLSYSGRLIGIVGTSIAFGAISLGVIWWRGYLDFRFEWRHVKDGLAFGVPLVPHTLSSWLKNGIDRFFMLELVGAAAVGVYTVGYYVGFVVGLFGLAFRRAWNPYLFERLGKADLNEKKRLVKITYLYFGGVAVVTGLVIAGAKILMPHLVGSAFSGSLEYVTWIAVAYAFQACQAVGAYIFYVKKTYLLAIVTFVSGALHAGLCYVLIRQNGAIGAAQASTISFFLTFVAVWVLSARVYPMPWFSWLRRSSRS